MSDHGQKKHRLLETLRFDASFAVRNTLGWLAFCAVLTMLNTIMHKQPVGREAAANLGLVICCLIGTYMLRIFILSKGEDAPWRDIYIHAFVLGIPICSFLMAFLGVEYHAIFILSHDHDPHYTFFKGMLGVWFFMAILFCGWAGIFISTLAVRRSTKAEVERLEFESALREAELKALRAQINPHFLFNSLNTIRALVNERPHRAQEAVLHLSLLLRAALRSDLMLCPLREEMETVGHYLELEKLRFEERLQVSMEISADALDVLVPTMLVQTLVENAVKHGIACVVNGGVLSMSGCVEKGRCVLRISNPGHLGGATSGMGMGLRNTRMRLARLLGEGASLNMLDADGRVTAELNLPFRKR